jgi:hypothetical protein
MAQPEPEHGRHRGRWVDAFVLLTLGLAVRLRDLSFAPDVDEFHHILAAQSLLTEGTLELWDGGTDYTRGLLFTLLVAGSFMIFGVSLEASRIPAILGGGLLVAVLYLWVRRHVDRLAAWIAALLLCLYPFGIYLTQVSRFYSLHALFFLLGVILLYRLSVAPGEFGRRSVALGVGAVLALTLSFHFQVTTVVGLGGLALWVAVAGVPRVREWASKEGRLLPLLLLVGGATVLGVAFLWWTGFAGRALFLFQYADPWAFENRGNLRYYHRHLQGDFGPLWALFPVLVLVALYRNHRLGLLCAFVFGLTFFVHSLAAWKHPRYIFYVMPFFFVLTGIAISTGIPVLRRWFYELVSRIPWRRVGDPEAPSGLRRAAWLGAGTVMTIFLLLGMGASSDFIRMMGSGPDPVDSPRPYRGKSEWAQATPILSELSAEKEVLVSYSHLKPPFYLERLDVILQRNHLYQGAEWQPEFTLQPQLARPVISEAESMARIVVCHSSGIVIGEHFGWRDPAGVPSRTVEWIETHLDPVDLPGEWRLLVYTWDETTDLGADAPETPECETLPVQAGVGT